MEERQNVKPHPKTASGAFDSSSGLDFMERTGVMIAFGMLIFVVSTSLQIAIFL